MKKVKWDRFRLEIETLYTPPLRALATLRQVRQVLRELGDVCSTTAELTEPNVARWVIDHPNRSPARSESLLRTLAPITRRAAKWGYCRCDPMEDRPPRSWLRPDARGPRQRVPRHRSPAEIARLLRLLDVEAATGSWEAGRLQALGYLYAYTGVRKCEALWLQHADIDLAGRVLRIQAKDKWIPKTLASAAPVPLAEPLAVVLERWLPRTGCDWVFPGKRLRGPWLNGMPGTKPLDQIKAAGERAGVPGITILGFRKTIGTAAKTWGISSLERKAVFRHTTTETGEFYDEDDLGLSRVAVSKIVYA